MSKRGWLTSVDVAAGNRKHDREHGHYEDWWSGNIGHGFNEARMFQHGALTDRVIERYRKAGYYEKTKRLPRLAR